MTTPPLTAERWSQIESIFFEALVADEPARGELLRRRCGGDTTLLADVAALLSASRREKEARAAAQGLAVSDSPAAPPGSTLPSGQRFGPWEIDRPLAHGGMGAVYLAHRADGQFEQIVALKLLGAHLSSEFFVARFVTERQILANLTHPNITRLLDGGITSEGVPYLVMEYVEGEPIDRYCDSRRLPVADRLRIFLQVCSAVEAAHRSLVIHRDLKPGNILVTPGGTPKLLDFGTAKLLTPGDADQTLTGVAMMTPRYASPEQLRGAAVTTLSDVYSLGIVLYELLTGQSPFGNSESLVSGVERALSGRDPAQPRTAVTEAAAAARSTNAARLERLLAGDLATIVLKAMRAVPDQRYGSVAQLSEDVERYLAGEPVLARPQTLGYRLEKWVRRNKALAAAAALLAIAVTAGVGATLWQAHLARAAQARAERRFADVHRLANYLVFDFGTALRRFSGTTTLQRQVVERSLEYLDSLARESSDDAQLQLELAEAYQRMGDVLGNPFTPSLGDRTGALESYSKAMAQVDHVLHANPRDRKARRLAATIRLQTGGALTFAGKGDEGIAQVERSVAELRALLPESPNDLPLRLALAKAFEFHATQVSQRGGLIAATKAAEDEDRESLSQLNLALSLNPQDARILRQFADTESAMGNLLGSVKPLEAIEHYRSAIGYLDRLPAEANESIEIRRVRAGLDLNLGWSLGQIDRYAEALDAIGKAEAILAAEAAADPENTSASYHLTAVYRSRGIVCGYAKMTDCAIDSFEKAAAIHERLLRKDPANVTYRALRGELLMRISGLLVKRGQAASAHTKAAEGLRILTALASEPKASATQATEACRWLVETEVKDLRDFQRAVALCEKAVALTHEKDSFSLERLANARAGLEDRKGAVEAAQKALALLPAMEPGKPKSRQRVSLEQSIASWRK